MRIDAQRNLEHVLRAAREVFGELGYGAPMEDVARRARVGVGTVYRRFPSKDVLVRRIAREETARLTEQARTALWREQEPWPALASFLRTSAASGAGRLLPPEVLRVGAVPGPVADPGDAEAGPHVPQQRRPGATGAGGPGEPVIPTETAGPAEAAGPVDAGEPADAGGAPGGAAPEAAGAPGVPVDADSAELLSVVGELVRRARDVGALRPDVTVGDVLLVIATAAPALPDAEQQEQASLRLLDILLEGLRARPER
ncbi:helix-turn-helix domain containing protein [Streptomyces sp. JHD 1]|nr:helix-turn-helix domain-containing protein [Streptomyces sp. JHD 1]MCX2970619.1 helix-turn-helix domain containing protein [Streptomyces sp. JHD 1]